MLKFIRKYSFWVLVGTGVFLWNSSTAWGAPGDEINPKTPQPVKLDLKSFTEQHKAFLKQLDEEVVKKEDKKTSLIDPLANLINLEALVESQEDGEVKTAFETAYRKNYAEFLKSNLEGTPSNFRFLDEYQKACVKGEGEVHPHFSTILTRLGTPAEQKTSLHSETLTADTPTGKVGEACKQVKTMVAQLSGTPDDAKIDPRQARGGNPRGTKDGGDKNGDDKKPSEDDTKEDDDGNGIDPILLSQLLNQDPENEGEGEGAPGGGDGGGSGGGEGGGGQGGNGGNDGLGDLQALDLGDAFDPSALLDNNSQSPNTSFLKDLLGSDDDKEKDEEEEKGPSLSDLASSISEPFVPTNDDELDLTPDPPAENDVALDQPAPIETTVPGLAPQPTPFFPSSTGGSFGPTLGGLGGPNLGGLGGGGSVNAANGNSLGNLPALGKEGTPAPPSKWKPPKITAGSGPGFSGAGGAGAEGEGEGLEGGEIADLIAGQYSRKRRYPSGARLGDVRRGEYLLPGVFGAFYKATQDKGVCGIAGVQIGVCNRNPPAKSIDSKSKPLTES